MNGVDKRRIVASSLGLLFSTLLLITVSFAWFASITKNSSSGINIEPMQQNIDVSFNIYKYDDETDKAVDVSNQSTLTMGAYDSVILSRNSHTAIILKLVVQGELINSKQALSCIFYAQSENYAEAYISNIVKLDLYTEQIDSADPSVIYSTVNDYFKLHDNDKRQFVVDGRKNLSILYNIKDYTTIDNKLIIYFYLDYDSELIADLDVFSTDDFNVQVEYSSDITRLELRGE